MLRLILATILVSASFWTHAAELRFDFGKHEVGSAPSNFVSTVSGLGEAGVWKIVEDDVPSAFAPLSPNATPSSTKRRVLAQTSKDTTDEHFPLLIYNNEVFGDFTVTTRFKCISGEKAQMAGLVFRYQDEDNFYVVRASASGNTFRFYKVVGGQRSTPIGPEIQIPGGTWHDLSVTCKGNQIRCSLNGKEAIPMLTDNSFMAGKIGFWTKSDAVSYFSDTHIEYTPREPIAQKVVRDMMIRYPRLLGLKITAFKASDALQVIASSNESEMGKAGSKTEASVIKEDQFYTAKGKESITVYLPLRDRNGETIAALSIKLKSFVGQTESNALARSLPINKEIAARIQEAKHLFE
ncbi:MAG: hypothetical protein H0X66_11090 [Verrucomicrobia bacterium]|nr:hypothetical protein [Verrucomicrobiota bacterium]